MMAPESIIRAWYFSLLFAVVLLLLVLVFVEVMVV